MNIWHLKGPVFGLEIISIKNWGYTLNQILNNIQFDLAVKYDNFWTDFYNNPPPYSDYEDIEITKYMTNNGVVESVSPLVWAFKDAKSLCNIIHGFINADRSIIAQINKPMQQIDVSVSEVESEEETIGFWAKNSHYFLTTLLDYSGLMIISSDKGQIDMIEKKFLRLFEIKQLRQIKG